MIVGSCCCMYMLTMEYRQNELVLIEVCSDVAIFLNIQTWFTRPQTVVYSGTNRDRRRTTMLMETNALRLSQTARTCDLLVRRVSSCYLAVLVSYCH